MEIKVDCPGCGKHYRVPGAFAGKKTKCKKCGGVLRIPAAEPEDDAPFSIADLAGLEDSSTSSVEPGVEAMGVLPQFGDSFAQTRRRKPIDPLVLKLGGVGLAAALVLGVGVWVVAGMLGGSEADDTNAPGLQSSTAQGAGAAGDESREAQFAREQAERLQEMQRLREERRAQRERIAAEQDRAREELQGPRDPAARAPQPATPEPATPPKPVITQQQRTWASSFMPIAPIALGEQYDQPRLAPEGAWTAEHDPPARAAMYQVHRNLDVGVERFSGAHLTRSETPSPFFVIGDASERVIADLRSGRGLWELGPSTLATLGKTALSPDGNLVADLGNDENAAVRIHLLSRRKPSEPTIIDAPAGVDRSIFFVSPTRLAVYTKLGSGKVGLSVIDVVSGETVWDLEPDGEFPYGTGVYAVSPGGRYIVLPGKHTDSSCHLRFFDTADGQVRGNAIAGVPDNADLAAHMRVQCLRFSPNGSRLLAVHAQNPGNTKDVYVGVWDSTTGERVYWRRVEIVGDRAGRTSFQSAGMLDNDRLVCVDGHTVVDAMSGRFVHALSLPNGNVKQSFPRICMNMQYIRLGESDQRSYPRKHAITSRQLDPQAFRRYLPLIEMGADYDEIDLPELASTFVTHHDQGFFVAQEAGAGWPKISEREHADPAAPPLEWNLEPIRIDRLTEPKAATSEWRHQFSAPSSRGLVIADFGDLVLLDLAGRGRPNRIRVPDNAVPIRVNDDGQTALLRYGPHRLAEIDLRSERVIASWRIRPEAPTPQLPGMIIDARRVGDRVWVVDSEGRVSVINAATDQMVMTGHQIKLAANRSYFSPHRTMHFRRFARPLDQLTADGRYLVCINALAPLAGEVVLVDLQSGRAVHRLGIENAHRCVVNDAGTLLASEIQDGRLRYLDIHNLRTGQRERRCMLPLDTPTYLDEQIRYRQGSITGLWAWADEDRVLFESTNGRLFVVNTITGRAEWRYRLRVPYETIPIGGRVWVFKIDTNGGLATVASVKLPHDEALEQVNNPERDDPLRVLAVGPGQAVRLEVSAPNGDELRDNLRAHFEAAGLVIDPSADVTFRVSTQTESEQHEYQSITGGGRDLTVTTRSIQYTYEWRLTNGTVLWRSGKTIANYAGNSIRLNEGEDGRSYQQDLDLQLERSYVTRIDAPTRLPYTVQLQVLGEHHVTAEGFVLSPPPNPQ